MAQAKITVNSVIGSNDALPIATLVQLNNINVGGEITFNWAILDQPVGPPDSLSSLSAQNPTFTPNKEGTYLIQLTVNLGLPTEEQDSVICAVRQEKTYQRIPAAGETTQDNQAEGWAVALNDYLQAIDTQLADPGTIVGVDWVGGLVSGNIVTATASAVIKGGLPGQETIPGFTLATSAGTNPVSSLCAIVLQSVGATPGGGPFSSGQIIKTKYIGRVPAQPLSGATVGQIVYMNDSGVLSLTPGTNRRQLGTVMSVSGSTADVWFDGVGGFEITPINAPYLTNGPASELTGSTDITHLTTTLHIAQNTGYHGEMLHIDALSGNTGNFLEATLAGTQIFSLGPDATLTIYNSGGTYEIQLLPTGRGGFKTLGYLSGAGGGIVTLDSQFKFDTDARIFGWPDFQAVVTGSGATADLNFSNPGDTSGNKVQLQPGGIIELFGNAGAATLTLNPYGYEVGYGQHVAAIIGSLPLDLGGGNGGSAIPDVLLGSSLQKSAGDSFGVKVASAATSAVDVQSLGVQFDGLLHQPGGNGYFYQRRTLRAVGFGNTGFGGLHSGFDTPPNIPYWDTLNYYSRVSSFPSSHEAEYQYVPGIVMDNSAELSDGDLFCPAVFYDLIQLYDLNSVNTTPIQVNATFTVVYATTGSALKPTLELVLGLVPADSLHFPGFEHDYAVMPTSAPLYVTFPQSYTAVPAASGGTVNIFRSSVTQSLTSFLGITSANNTSPWSNDLTATLIRADTNAGSVFVMGLVMELQVQLADGPTTPF